PEGSHRCAEKQIARLEVMVEEAEWRAERGAVQPAAHPQLRRIDHRRPVTAFQRGSKTLFEPGPHLSPLQQGKATSSGIRGPSVLHALLHRQLPSWWGGPDAEEPILGGADHRDPEGCGSWPEGRRPVPVNTRSASIASTHGGRSTAGWRSATRGS